MDLPLASFVIDDESGLVLSANKVAEELFGVAGLDLSTTRLIDLLALDRALSARTGVTDLHVEVPMRGAFEIVIESLHGTESGRARSLVMLTPWTGDLKAHTGSSPIVGLEHVAQTCRTLEGDVLCVAVGVVGLEAVNYDFSRSTGDFAISEFHHRLRLAGGAECAVERIDGNRFLVLVPAGPDDPMNVRRLVNVARQPIVTSHGDVVLGCAAGVMVGPSRAPLVLFDGAIRRLERALERGAGTIEWVDSSNRPRLASARLAAPLLAAVAAGEIVAEAHPVVWLSSGAVMELEASATWPAHADLTSRSLVDVARDIGILVDLRAAVLKSAVDLLGWHGGCDGFWRVSISVGARELTSTSFVETTLSQLIDAGVARTRVQIDVSDDVPECELPSVKYTIAALRASGVRVALDGLRYGAVSWSSLDGLDVDAIKVEADLLTGEPRSGHSDSALRSVLELADELGLDVVATCVETPEQRDRLLTNGFVFGQGPLFAKPHIDDLSITQSVHQASPELAWPRPWGASPTRDQPQVTA